MRTLARAPVAEDTPRRTTQQEVTVREGRTHDEHDPNQRLDEAGARIAELAGSRSWRLAFDASYEGALFVRIGEESGLSITLEEGCLTVDLTGTRYPHGGRRVVTLEPGEASRVEILHDRSITEIYLGDGTRVFTTRSFLNGDGSGVTLTGAASVTNVSAARAD